MKNSSKRGMILCNTQNRKSKYIAPLPFHSLTCMPQGTFFPETNRGRKSHYSELRQPILGKATKQQWKRPIWFGYIFRQITAWSVTLVCFKLCYGFILSHLETNRGRKSHLAIMKKAWWHTRRGIGWFWFHFLSKRSMKLILREM